MKKIIVISAINILLVAGQLGLAMGRSADGVSLSQLNERRLGLRQANDLLAQDVYTRSSLAYIASQSARLGLVSGMPRFVSPQAYVAAARLTP